MKSIDRSILIAVPVIVALAAFYFLVVSPKQDEVKKLDARVSTLQTTVEQQRATVAQGIEARKGFPRRYHRLVVSGKAVPSKDETASLLVQVNRAAIGSGINFKSISGGGDSAGAAGAASAAPAPTTTTTPTASAPGITPVSYSLTFEGTFFQIADFIARMDRLVNPKGQRIASDGRLFTISDFSLGPNEIKPLPALAASLSVSAYSADPTLSLGALATSTATPASSTTVPPTDTSTTTGTPATP